MRDHERARGQQAAAGGSRRHVSRAVGSVGEGPYGRAPRAPSSTGSFAAAPSGRSASAFRAPKAGDELCSSRLTNFIRHVDTLFSISKCEPTVLRWIDVDFFFCDQIVVAQGLESTMLPVLVENPYFRKDWKTESSCEDLAQKARNTKNAVWTRVKQF